ncbi:MAG: hypothetical protein LUI09_07390 [Prevotellaceae bacterium]|nr:hypothetical protein [Prevotellaceae bacterium]
MRRLIIILSLLLCPLCSACYAQSNRDARVAYVLKNLGINSATQKKLQPLLTSYLSEKKAASDEYNALKAKLKANIKSETLTNDQASRLLSLRWAAEAKETAVKKKYTEKFETVLSAKKTYKCFSLLNDKKSKVQGKSKSKDDDDDDDD